MAPVKTFFPLVEKHNDACKNFFPTIANIFAICENINTFDKKNLKFYVRLKKYSIILRDLLNSGGK